jgi:precorrin-6B methylase 1
VYQVGVSSLDMLDHFATGLIAHAHSVTSSNTALTLLYDVEKAAVFARPDHSHGAFGRLVVFVGGVHDCSIVTS